MPLGSVCLALIYHLGVVRVLPPDSLQFFLLLLVLGPCLAIMPSDACCRLHLHSHSPNLNQRPDYKCHCILIVLKCPGDLAYMLAPLSACSGQFSWPVFRRSVATLECFTTLLLTRKLSCFSRNSKLEFAKGSCSLLMRELTGFDPPLNS